MIDRTGRQIKTLLYLNFSSPPPYDMAVAYCSIAFRSLSLSLFIINRKRVESEICAIKYCIALIMNHSVVDVQENDNVND